MSKYSRALRKASVQAIKDHVNMAEHLVRPKPWWLPRWVWVRIVHIVIPHINPRT